MNTKLLLHRHLILLFLLVAPLFLAGCIQQTPVHAYTMEDNGNTYTVRMNDIVMVSLASNPTTGYEWSADTTGNLVISDQEFISDNVPGMVGEGGFQKWTLSA
ncbi:MAG: protease inhibitor I42 family protein, partial [Methanospirillaceae archaeon]|nr:protease inhibitor I42 family protein [Methanospirillaceae archaeon]